MSIETEVQKFNPSALVELWVLDGTDIGGSILRFHANTQIGPIYWQGQQYDPWPIAVEGFARATDKPSNPKLSAGNLQGSISTLCRLYGDLVGCVVTRIRTLAKFLDAENFDPPVNLEADPTEEMPREIWFIERKSVENNVQVEFELVSAFDLAGVKLPRRQIIANYCGWKSVGGYRGEYCGYTGPAVAKADGTPTTEPSEDDCGGHLSDCKLREWPDEVLNFGGFPAAGLMRT